MSQKGEHTWDIHIHYHRCPQCGYIIESRDSYVYRQGKYMKEVVCKRCRHSFFDYKQTKLTIGPLIGDPQPIETEWGDPKCQQI